jgi:hypothetical protein
MDIRSRNFDIERRLSDLEHESSFGIAEEVEIDDSNYPKLDDSNDFTGNNYFKGNILRVGGLRVANEVSIHAEVIMLTSDTVMIKGTETGAKSTLYLSSKITELEGVDSLLLKGDYIGLTGPTSYTGPIDEPKQIVTKEYVDALEERVRHLERLMQGLGVG